MPKYKEAALAVEEVSDGGHVRAYASTFDRDPDCYGDVIAPNAFDATIERWKELGKPVPLLWGHDTFDPMSNIGAVTDLATDERGLVFDADFDADNPRAQYVRKLISEGRVFQCSFAYEVRDQSTVELESGVKANELRDVELFEISIVQIPANQHATIEEVKAFKYGRRNSKSDEDKIKEAISLLNSVLDDEQGEDDGKEDDAEGGEGDANPKGREAEYAEAVKYAKSVLEALEETNE